jgi:hypothetical protein
MLVEVVAVVACSILAVGATQGMFFNLVHVGEALRWSLYRNFPACTVGLRTRCTIAATEAVRKRNVVRMHRPLRYNLLT